MELAVYSDGSTGIVDIRRNGSRWEVFVDERRQRSLHWAVSLCLEPDRERLALQPGYPDPRCPYITLLRLNSLAADGRELVLCIPRPTGLGVEP